MTYEAVKVGEYRRKGYGWQAIASLLGRNRDDVRRDYDPSFQFAKPVLVVEEPPKAIPHSRDPNYLLGEEMKILRTLYEAEGIVSLQTTNKSRSYSAVRRLRYKHGEDILRSINGRGFRLTDKGRALYERLAQVSEAA